jgi:site-specific recombinase XerD
MEHSSKDENSESLVFHAGQEMHILEALESFLLALSVSGRSPHTLKLYRRSIEQLALFLGETHIGNISTANLRQYLSDLQQVVNPTTVGIRWRSIRAFFNWLCREGYLPIAPTKRIEHPKQPKMLPKCLSDSELIALLGKAKARAHTWNGLRDYAILLTLLDTGIRRGELLNMTVSCLNMQDHSMKVIGKASRERQVFFGSKLRRELQKWLNKRTLKLPGDALFCARDGYALSEVTDIIAKLARSAEMKRIGCHALRHTFATNFVRNGGDPFSLQRLLGHTNIETSLVYVHMVGAELRRVHAKSSPLDRLVV